jgi:hypothetical protein
MSNEAKSSATETYGTSPVKLKRARRTTSELDYLKGECLAVLAEYEEAITIRHLFYRLTGRRAICKTEKDYKNLCTQLTKWRKRQEIPFGAFIDGTRWHHGAATYSSAQEALLYSVQSYRKNLWNDQPYYVELWAEKDAILSIIQPIANEWGIPVFPCRGFASISSLFETAQTFKAKKQQGKDSIILYLGDHDPSGIAIDAAIQKTWRYFDMAAPTFERLAVFARQIEEYDLPTRPVKETDKRGKGWIGGCVEIDTLTPAQIRALVDARLVELVDADQWKRTKWIEEAELEAMQGIMIQGRRILDRAEQQARREASEGI